MIDPSVRAVLRSPYTIRRFFLLYGGVFLGAVAALWAFAAGLDADSTLRVVAVSFLGKFAAAVAIFILTYGLYVLVTPPGLRDAQVLPLHSGEIADQILNLQANVSDYWFWGRSGSYFRSAVLPKLDKASSDERRHIRILVIMPDPSVSGNAARYMQIKHGLGEKADEKTLAANVLATIVAVASATARNPYLHAEIGLCANVPVLRYDMSTTGALLTRDAQALPAILVNAGNPYFDMFRDTVENEFDQSRKIRWDKNAAPLLNDGKISVQEALSAIEGLPAFEPGVADQAENLLDLKSHRYKTTTIIDAVKTFGSRATRDTG